MTPGAPSRTAASAVRVRVDPLACEAVGMCAHLAPSLIALDRWGYPVLPREALDADQRRSVTTAIAGCPRKALLLEHLPLP